MSTYNDYQKLHYKALYGEQKVKPSIDRRYKLVYNNSEVCIPSGSYTLCNGTKTKLTSTGRYQKHLFKILPL